jgi:hypothetical protein
MLSLIKALKHRRDPEAIWREGGWGPTRAFPTSGFDGEPLMLTLRLPLGWDAADLLKVPPEMAADVKPGSLAEAITSTASVAGTSGAIAVLGMTRPIEREGKPDARALLSMTVALSDLPGPAPESIPDAEVKPVEFKDEDRDYRGVRIQQIRSREVLPGVLPFLTVQFMLETEHGWLVITFATPQANFFTRTETLFDKIAETCLLKSAA